jgi:hypothetical protein
MNPRGQEEAHGEAEQMRHRAAAELAGARRNRARNASAIQNRQRGIRVRSRPSGGESEGAASWAELVRSSPLGLTDRWAQAVSQSF